MLFNSIQFCVFFACVYALYLFMRDQRRGQNTLLLVASYVFYGSWDWRFLGLIVLSTVVDYLIGRTLGRTTDKARRRQLVTASVLTNLSILGFFKYFDFFAESLAEFAARFGLTLGDVTLDIVLPVGISFYTFQTLSYTIDIYRGKLEPTEDVWDFALFVAFFPQLVAGPIERASAFLPQIATPRVVTASKVNSGIFLIVWGLFKKVVIADNLAAIANTVFNDYGDYHGLDLAIGALAFTVQIYCDFSGYSDIARGLSKLLGFDLMVNFKLPYVARNPSDFWQRWHISLSSWLRDYLYISLGGNRGGNWNTYRNLTLTMLLGGLWHGASWNFIYWGAYHGLLLVAFRWLQPNPPDDPGRVRWLIDVITMFAFTVLGWIIFRAPDADTIVHFVTHMGIALSSDSVRWVVELVFFTAPLVAIQIWQHRTNDLLAPANTRLPLRALILGAMIAGIFVLGVTESVEFIYFQF